MSPSLPISRSSSSSSFCFVHPDKNSPSLNGIPDCTKMAHITVLKESHHSKFQLYICSTAAVDIVALCKNDSISEVKLTRRSSRLSRKLTRGRSFELVPCTYVSCCCCMWLIYIFSMLLLHCWWCWTEWDEGTIQLLLRACTYWKDGHFWIIFCTCPL